MIANTGCLKAGHGLAAIAMDCTVVAHLLVPRTVLVFALLNIYLEVVQVVVDYIAAAGRLASLEPVIKQLRETFDIVVPPNFTWH